MLLTVWEVPCDLLVVATSLGEELLAPAVLVWVPGTRIPYSGRRGTQMAFGARSGSNDNTAVVSCIVLVVLFVVQFSIPLIRD
jgi:hypothetical protein